jgi:hypothetical protein
MTNILAMYLQRTSSRLSNKSVREFGDNAFQGDYLMAMPLRQLCDESVAAMVCGYKGEDDKMLTFLWNCLPISGPEAISSR